MPKEVHEIGSWLTTRTKENDSNKKSNFYELWIFVLLDIVYYKCLTIQLLLFVLN